MAGPRICTYECRILTGQPKGGMNEAYGSLSVFAFDVDEISAWIYGGFTDCLGHHLQLEQTPSQCRVSRSPRIAQQISKSSRNRPCKGAFEDKQIMRILGVCTLQHHTRGTIHAITTNKSVLFTVSSKGVSPQRFPTIPLLPSANGQSL